MRLESEDGERTVLRLMTKEPWRTYSEELLHREAATQRRLAATAIPAPRSLGADPAGDEAGAPAHLMSWLPGRLRLDSAAAEVLDGLARLLAEIPLGRREAADFQFVGDPGQANSSTMDGTATVVGARVSAPGAAGADIPGYVPA
ncbi:hypothetical protein Ade02nite_96100 [Paractinoplanes deccanensis]|uniref:Aminoglycoside phosphotransferase domain-containing protein n=1 Tax=Paractinoplanes deccanensis TaxID=113561 RepID=A0ABQ3YLV0_9ACTN|nr:hypothetical protein Ade02nite_96100 [Actinoplanes deccanensis]